MTNLINTEKALKHWLKNKVAVTTATVVGFLIMGTVSFGADHTIDENNKIIEIKENSVSGIFEKKFDSKINIEEKGIIDITGKNSVNGILIHGVSDKSSITNNGIIKATVKGGGSASAIAVQGNITADLTITNNKGARLETNYIE